MEITEAIALANVPPRELIVKFGGSEYAIMLPEHDENGNGVYYTQLFTRRLEMGLIQGDSGILAGAYQWYRKGKRDRSVNPYCAECWEGEYHKPHCSFF